MIILKHSKIFVTTMLALLLSFHVNAQLYVIVNKSNPLNSISSGSLKRVYLGKIVKIPGSGRSLYPIDLPSRSLAKAEFVKKVMRMKASLLMQYRSRQIFSGKGRIPLTAGSNGAVESTVARRSNAIGYISSAPRSAKVKNYFGLMIFQSNSGFSDQNFKSQLLLKQT